MKKIALTLAIVLGLSISTFAQYETGGGLFKYGAVSDEYYYGSSLRGGSGLMDLSLNMPDHGTTDDAPAPLGTGIAVLIGFGAAYALRKRSKK